MYDVQTKSWRFRGLAEELALFSSRSKAAATLGSFAGPGDLGEREKKRHQRPKKVTQSYRE